MKFSDETKKRRIHNLKKWIENNNVPKKESSLFSQLVSGKSSFGEKLSRRLESDYDMGDGYLDSPIQEFNLENMIVGGDSIVGNNNEMTTYNIHTEQCDDSRDEIDIAIPLLKALPLLDIDDGVFFVLYPNEAQDKIKEKNEKVVSFVYGTSSTIGIKVSDNSVKNTSGNHIVEGDIIIVEPAVKPRANDIVLVALEAQTKNRRGILAKLKIDFDGNYFLSNDDYDTPTKMPIGSVICGTVIEVKRRLIEIDIADSRYEKKFNVWDTLAT